MSLVDHPMPKKARTAAAILGATGVALGAFGAHALKAMLEANDRIDTWETAVFYHLVHSLALLILSAQPSMRRSTFYCFVGGVAVFSGSLYLLCLSGLNWLGAITPIGGICLIAGWLSCLLPTPKAQA